MAALRWIRVSRTIMFCVAICQIVVILILFSSDDAKQHRVSVYVHRGLLHGDVLEAYNKSFNITQAKSARTMTNRSTTTGIQYGDKMSFNEMKSITAIPRNVGGGVTNESVKETVRCSDLINGYIPSYAAINKTLEALRWGVRSDGAFFPLTRDCEKFTRQQGYFNKPIAEEELNFPLAFTMLVYKSAHQVEHLLRTIYRPHNTYCIHVDAKSPVDLHLAMENICRCLDNVFIASRLENVTWGTISIVKAERHCQKELLAKGKNWKYLINLTGQEFPLKTNLEIVQILTQFNGQNDIRTLAAPVQNWTYYRHEVVDGQIRQTNIRKTEPRPGNLTVHKGPLFSALSRPFVEFLQSDIAEEWLQWFNDTKNSDESFTQTLASHPDAPGGPGPIGSKALMSRDVVWSSAKAPRVCYGKFVRDVCVHSWRDLTWLAKSPRLFANKFHVDYDELVLQCLGEMINNRTFNSPGIDLDRYRRFVKFRIGPPKSPK